MGDESANSAVPLAILMVIVLAGGRLWFVGRAWYDVSDDGQIVIGELNLWAGPAIWDSENGWRELEQVIDDLGVLTPGWTLIDAPAISGDGTTIVGSGANRTPTATGDDWSNIVLPVSSAGGAFAGPTPKDELTAAQRAYMEENFPPPPVPCPADCDQNGQLNILDFVCFQDLFTQGSLDADCTGDAQLNILDFVCFQNAFQAGCR